MSSSIAIYVHIPYCMAKCPYCDFNSYGIGDKDGRRSAEFREKEYTEALLRELVFYAEQKSWSRRNCHSIFFGGGTPSLFSVEAIGKIIASIGKHFPATADIEVTLEANPGTVFEELGAERLLGYRSVGVNRISVGAQSFTEQKLKKLGRLHSAEQTHSSVENIRRAGFDNFNLDLIFGVSNESFDDWQYDLQQAIELKPTHISAYNLTIEPGTEFAVQIRKGTLQLPTDELSAQMYQFNQKHLSENGYPQYEISNFAQPGNECRHNLSYWAWQDYLSLGAGAHSFLKIESEDLSQVVAQRWSNIPKPEHYIERSLKGDCSQLRETVDREQAELEYLYCRLRTRQGLPTAEYQQIFQKPFHQHYAQVVGELEAEQLIAVENGITSLTAKGYLFSDEVLSRFARNG